MNPDDNVTYPAFLTSWVIHLAKAEDVGGLVRLFTVANAINAAMREVAK